MLMITYKLRLCKLNRLLSIEMTHDLMASSLVGGGFARTGCSSCNGKPLFDTM